ncbi:MAG TPA: hypothetical protein VGW33_06430 [Terriglobia bacterium]|nr:hypothetical protein [Terriglobia bacterium]
MHIQYLGFQPQARGRDYSYRVIDAKSADREFIFTISHEAFAERHIPFQDGADICYQKLQRALDLETAEQPLARRSMLSDQELDEYREKHRPAKRRA